MFARTLRKETVSKQFVRHFFLSTFINVFLLFALIVTSCVPTQNVTPVAQKTTGSAALARRLVPQKDNYTSPIPEYPEPRTADRADLDIQTTSSVLTSPNSTLSSFTEDSDYFDPEAYFQTLQNTAKQRAESFTLPPNPVRAVTPVQQSVSNNGVFTVTTLADTDDGVCDNDCSFREAIYAANDERGANTITFSVSGTLQIDGPLPYSTDPAGLTIDGSGQPVTFGGKPAGGVSYAPSRVSSTSGHLADGDSGCPPSWSEGSLTLTGVTLSDCYIRAGGSITITNSSITGGYIRSVNSTLDIGNSTITAVNVDVSGGVMTISASTIAGNSTDEGNLILSNGSTLTGVTFINTYVDGVGTVSLNGNNTFTGSNIDINTASITGSTTVDRSNASFVGTMTVGDETSGDRLTILNSWFGGAIDNLSTGTLEINNSTLDYAPINNNGALRLRNSTLADSSITDAASLYLYNTILANGSECHGTVAAGHNNLIESSGSAACGLTNGVNGNIIGSNALLGPLTVNGYTYHYPLLADSPAIDAGNNTTCAAAPISNTSQNGVTRPVGKRCDIGSYEALSVVDPRATASTCHKDQCISAAGGTFKPAGNPINTLTGGYDYNVMDISIPTSAGALTFTRDYASKSINQSTTLSPGWTHNHATRLIMPDGPGGEEEAILFKLHSGNLFAFYEYLDGTYRASPGLVASLARQAGPPVRFIVTDAQQNSYMFDEDGVLQSYQDSMGNVWEYTYSSGRLTQVSADGGSHYLSLRYDAQGRVDQVSDHTGRFVTYHYSASGDLDYVIDVLGQTWTYEYELTLDHFLTRVAAPGDVTVERTEYYPDGRAWKQFDGEGNLVVELIYNDNGTTTVKDSPSDPNPETLTYDERGTLTAQENGVGGVQEKQYDLNFRPDLITDPLGNETTLIWSVSGANLTQIVDAKQGTTNITYGALNNPTSIIDPLRYETKYFYEDSNFPTLPTRIEYPLSFDGGVTYIGTDYQYYPPASGASAGKVELVTDAQGHKTHYTYTSSGQLDVVITAYQTPKAQTTNYDYDDLGRLVKVTDPAGVITRNKYDAAGRLTVVINNIDPGTPNEEDPPQNLVSGDNIYNLYTRYYYDVRGHQIAVVDTDWNITRTYYDLADRLIGVVQNLVINSTPASSEAEALTAINTSLASVPSYNSGHPDWNIQTNMVYDDAGNVLETRDPQGIITRNSYDQANRLTLTIQNFVGTGVYNPANPDQNVRTEYFYDLNNNLIATKDTLGVITRTYYDALNRPATVVQNLTGQTISVTTPPGRGTNSNIRTDTYYDANGNVIASVDPRSVITRTYYDALNRLVAVVQNLVGRSYTDPTLPDPGQGQCGTESNLCSFTYYDQAGNVVATVDPRGVVTRTYYDEANRPVAMLQNWTGTDLYGDLSTAPAYNPAVPDENVRTTVAYNSDGYRDTTIDPLGRVTKYAYNDLGQLLSVTANYVNGGVPQNDQDQRNIVTQYVYDALGRQTQTTDMLGRVTLNAYDDLGRVTSVTQNYLQGQPQNYKDASGNQYNLITTYLYGVHGNQIAVTDTAGVITRTYYDALARPVTVVRNLVGYGILLPLPPARANPPSSIENLRTDTVYLGNGSVDYVVDEMGKTADYGYDPLGRLITTVDPLLKSTSFEYDANGNRTLMTDAEGVATKYEYDPLNRLKAVIENYVSGITPDQETNVRTSYTYDANGSRLSIRDGQSHLEGVDYRTTFTYDALGRLKTESDPLSNTTTYSYDALGNRVSLLDANGATTTYGYDELNRLALIDYPAPNADVTFDYDPLGRRQSMVDGLGTTAWDYNNLDLPNSITDPFAASVSYDYDEVGNRTSLTYPDSSVVSYQYNDVNRLIAVSGQQLAVSYEYDAAGHLKTVTRPNGVNTLYNYYDNGWLQDITHSSGTETLASYQYQYDNVGNRTQAIENILFPTLPLQSPEQVALASQEDVTSPATTTDAPTTTDTPPPTGTTTASLTPDTSTPADSTPPPSTGDTLIGTDELASVSEAGTGYSVALLHMNGADAATTFTDELGKTWTANGEAQIDTAQAKFGGASGFFDGTGDHLTTPDHDDFYLANGDWTMEFWVRFNAIGTTVNLVSQHQDANNWMDVWVGESGSNLYFAHKAGGVMTARFSAAASFSTNTWYHVVIERSGNTPKIAVNGTFLAVTESMTISGKTLSNLSGPLAVAAYNGSGALNGWLDEFRFSKGIARWTNNFTPPSAEYVFTVLPGTATLVSPSGDIGRNYSPTYTWNQVETATWYYLWVNSSSGNVFKQWYQASAICTGGTCSVTPAVTLGGGSHTWWVQTWNEEGYGPWSSAMNFSTTIPTPPIAATLVSPSGSTSPQPTYTWNAVLDSAQGDAATWYYLSVNGPSGNVIQQWYEASAVCNGATCSVTPAVSLNIGDYTWWIRTWNPTGYGPWSSGMSFNATTPTATPSPTLTPTFTPTPTQIPSGPVTIDYVYDPLYRLKEANYSNGDYYHYTYDAVGNRLTQQKSIIGLVTTDTYVYDDANRLTSVNGVTYTWDANGNLLNDGVNTYTYNTANQLKTLTGPSVNTSYAYNGLGDRLQEVHNGQTTNFTMDLNAVLTQALSDGTNNYIYGNGRIAQAESTGTEYFLDDALESVRQLTNASGAITYASAYDPYGATTQTYGASQTAYGFTGEYTSNDLVYLRARYYAPDMGRFLTQDTWEGNANSPMSFNRWMYVEGNPINYIDPNGQSPNCPQSVLGGDWCARQRLLEIVYAETKDNGAVALVRSFQDKELFENWGTYAGKTSSTRLEWILKVTQGSDVHNSLADVLSRTVGLPVYFDIDWGSDFGFCNELRDSQLYPGWGLDSSDSNQVGHFLSAVGVTYYGWALGALVGHEQYSDTSGLKNLLSYATVSTEDMKHWFAAVKYDKQGLKAERDAELWAILHFDASVSMGEAVEGRQGNSLQDLRLSLKGFRFAQWVKQNPTSHPILAAAWLQDNLMPSYGT